MEIVSLPRNMRTRPFFWQQKEPEYRAETGWASRA